MTQSSYFFDGLTAGDAVLAPYNDPEVAEALHAFLGTSFVVAGYDNNLEVTSSGALDQKVNLLTGAAYCFGYHYRLTVATTFTLDAQAGPNNRIDRIVLRVDTANQVITPVVIKGAAAVAPTRPAITVTTDLPLFAIWLPAGFGGGGAANLVASGDIHDERVMWHPRFFQDKYVRRNQVTNGEFMAYAQGHAAATAPDQWVGTGVMTGMTKATALGTVPRGRAVSVNNANLIQYMQPPTADSDGLASMQFVLRAMIKPVGGTVELRVVAHYVAGGPTTVSRTLRELNTEIDYRLRVGIAKTLAGSPLAGVSIQFLGASTYTIGQVMFIPGYVPGPYQIKHELIMFDSLCTDANWADTAKATGALLPIDLSAAFNANILRSTEMAVLRYRWRSAGSAAAASCGLLFGASNISGFGMDQATYIAGLTNNTPRESDAYVPIDKIAAYGFTVQLDDTNGNVTISIKGIYT